MITEENINNPIEVISKTNIQCILPKTKIQRANSEHILKSQRERIKAIKDRIKSSRTKEENPINNKVESSLISLNDHNSWDFTSFDYEVVEADEVPLLYSTNEWDMYPYLKQYSSSKGIELRNIALRSSVKVDYSRKGIELNASVILKGESSFWIFTRSYISSPDENNFKDIDKDNTLLYADILNKYSSIIKISKEDKSQKCFLSFSSFVEDEHGVKHYKAFYKRQLINYSKSKNQQYTVDDACEFKIMLIDHGNESISTKIYMNDSRLENDSVGDFFLPVSSESKLIIAGTGQSINLKTLVCKSFVKEDNVIQITTERRNCDCCIIY